MAADSKKKTPAPVDFESSAKKLEQIITRLEEETTPLNESLGLFEQGIQLCREAQENLSLAEQKIRVLTEDKRGPAETQFSTPEDD